MPKINQLTPYRIPYMWQLLGPREHLTIIHDAKLDFLECLVKSQLSFHCDLQMEHFRPQRNQFKSRNRTISVTEMVRYIPAEIIAECLSMITVEVDGTRNTLGIQTKSQQGQLCENVSEITGVAIPSYYEFQTQGHMTIYEQLKEPETEMSQFSRCLLDDTEDSDETTCGSGGSGEVRSLYHKIMQHEAVSQSLLRLATLWVCQQTGYDFKKNQIERYDWLPDDILEESFERVIYESTSHQ